MAGKLARQTSEPAGLVAQFFEAPVVQQARKVRDEVMLTEFKAAGALAFAAKNMQGAIELDNIRQQLSQGDPTTSAMLMDFEEIALQKIKNLQRGLFSDFGL